MTFYNRFLESSSAYAESSCLNGLTGIAAYLEGGKESRRKALLYLGKAIEGSTCSNMFTFYYSLAGGTLGFTDLFTDMYCFFFVFIVASYWNSTGALATRRQS